MSNRTVLILLALAIILIGTAMLLLKAPSAWMNRGGANSLAAGSLAPGDRVMDFAPSGVWKIDITSDGKTASIFRAGSQGAPQPPHFAFDAEWLLVRSGDKGTWPIPPAQVQGLLRVLSETRSVALAPRGSKIDADASRISLHMRDGSMRTVRIASRPLGGTVLAEFSEALPPAPTLPGDNKQSASVPPPARLALISDDLHRLCTSPGPEAWRDRTPFASLAPDASRVRLESSGRVIALAKIDGRWVMREPASAPCDQAAITALLATLSKVRIDSFDPPLTSDRESTSAGSLVQIEADRRSLAQAVDAPPKITTLQASLRVLAPSDAQGTRLIARLDDTPIVADAAGLASISPDPGTYIDASPVALNAMDVTSVRVDLPGASANFVRSDLQWSPVAATSADDPLPSSHVIDELVRFLTAPASGAPSTLAGSPGPGAALPQTTPTRPTILLESPQGLVPLGSIALNEQSESLRVNIGQTDSGKRIWLQTGKVFRGFPLAALPGWLRKHLAAPAEPEAAAGDNTPPPR